MPHKNMPIPQTEGYFENSKCRFLEQPMLFLLALNENSKKEFLNVKTKTNSSFAIKITEISHHLFLLSIWWITFFRHLHNGGVTFHSLLVSRWNSLVARCKNVLVTRCEISSLLASKNQWFLVAKFPWHSLQKIILR